MAANYVLVIFKLEDPTTETVGIFSPIINNSTDHETESVRKKLSKYLRYQIYYKRFECLKWYV